MLRDSTPTSHNNNCPFNTGTCSTLHFVAIIAEREDVQARIWHLFLCLCKCVSNTLQTGSITTRPSGLSLHRWWGVGSCTDSSMSGGSMKEMGRKQLVKETSVCPNGLQLSSVWIICCSIKRPVYSSNCIIIKVSNIGKFTTDVAWAHFGSFPEAWSQVVLVPLPEGCFCLVSH